MKLKSSTIRTALGLLIVLVGLFLPQIQDRIPDLKPRPPAPSVEIKEPTEAIKQKTLKVAEKVTDSKDRLELCVFNKSGWVANNMLATSPAAKAITLNHKLRAHNRANELECSQFEINE